MTATKAWVAGNTIDIAERSSAKWDLDSLLDSRVVTTLNHAIALNCTASLRRQASGSENWACCLSTSLLSQLAPQPKLVHAQMHQCRLANEWNKRWLDDVVCELAVGYRP